MIIVNTYEDGYRLLATICYKQLTRSNHPQNFSNTFGLLKASKQIKHW